MRLPIQAQPIMRQRRVGFHLISLDESARLGITPQNGCSACTSILGDTIYGLAKSTCWAGCWAVEAGFDAACDLAFGGPEDPVGDVVCPIAGVLVGQACSSLGCDNLKNKSYDQQLAQQACTQAHIC